MDFVSPEHLFEELPLTKEEAGILDEYICDYDFTVVGKQGPEWIFSFLGVVRAAVVDSKLFGEVIQRVKVVAGVKPFLVLPVAAFRLAVVAGCIRTDEFVPDAWFSGGSFKQGG